VAVVERNADVTAGQSLVRIDGGSIGSVEEGVYVQ
jgi:hypothetical protein